MTINCKASVPAERNLLNEKNDCTVRALQNALEIPYLEAYGMLLGAGRKRRKGLHCQELYNQFGAIQPRPNMTVQNYIRFIAGKGNWIIQIRSHVFAVVNGTIIDANPAANLNRHVVTSWKVKD